MIYLKNYFQYKILEHCIQSCGRSGQFGQKVVVIFTFSLISYIYLFLIQTNMLFH